MFSAVIKQGRELAESETREQAGRQLHRPGAEGGCWWVHPKFPSRGGVRPPERILVCIGAPKAPRTVREGSLPWEAFLYGGTGLF